MLLLLTVKSDYDWAYYDYYLGVKFHQFSETRFLAQFQGPKINTKLTAPTVGAASLVFILSLFLASRTETSFSGVSWTHLRDVNSLMHRFKWRLHTCKPVVTDVKDKERGQSIGNRGDGCRI